MASLQSPKPSRNRHRRPRPYLNASRGAATATAAAVASDSTSRPSQAPTPVVSSAAPSRPDSPSKNFSSLRFADLLQQNRISPSLAGNIPFEFCTEVQAATIDAALSGDDILARAKTGTGKTLAFLVPSLERMTHAQPPIRADKISILVISPTRELAQQIAREAETLVKGTACNVQSVVGGTNINSERKQLNGRCDILVATPGRFLDHVGSSDLKTKLSQLRTLVLDEADRLLDSGFRRELLAILESLPDRKTQPRQVLLFSATVSEEVKKIASLALLTPHRYISTITDNDQSTHEHVKQEYIITPHDDLLPLTVKFISEYIQQANNNDKMIVFFPTARATGLAYELFSALNPPFPIPCFQIHSRMSQPQRTRSTDAFRAAPTAVLFSSDVTARGMDFTGIGCVLQIGLPTSGEQYIHRLGRTARAGKEGAGLLILSQFEAFFLKHKDVKELPLVPHPNHDAMLKDSGLRPWRERTNDALGRVSDDAKAKAYAAWLGFYKAYNGSRGTGWDARQLVDAANHYALDILRFRGEEPGRPPALQPKAVGMMGLRGVPGLYVEKPAPREPRVARQPAQSSSTPSGSLPSAMRGWGASR